jgi:proton glutamate symport protein
VKRLSLTSWIFIGMALGVVLGVVRPDIAKQLGPAANVFLRLIRSIVAPLVFATLVAGIAGGGDLKRMGRIGAKAIVFFEIVTTLSLFLGLAAVNLVQPGRGVPKQATAAEQATPAAPASLSSILEHVFPTSIIDAMARNDILQVVVFAFLFGAACAAIGAKSDAVVTFCGSLAEVMFRYTNYVMYLAPVGVGAALAVTVGSKGITVLFGLSKLILTMYVASAIVIAVVLVPCAGAVPLHLSHPGGEFLACRARAFPDCLLHRQQ